MRNRKGFTLMELLLVVAVLAIVAAAAAPTFFGGATEAMNEAKRSQFLSAYQNTLSGTNLYMSIEAAKGVIINNADLTANLGNYAPAAARTFNNGTADVVLTANVNTDNTVVIMAGTEAVKVDANWETISKYSNVAP